MRKLIVTLITALLTVSPALAQHVPFGPVFPHTSGGSAPTWAFVQDAANFSCLANPCTVTFSSPTTAGSVIVAAVASHTGTDTITTVNDGTSATPIIDAASTWNLCTSSGCQAVSTNIGATDVAYSVSGVGGATLVNITDAASNPEFVAAIEIKCTANCGTIALDATPNVFGNSTSCTSCTAASFTGLTGTSDVIVQFLNYDNAPLSTPSAGYVLAPSGLFLYHLNSAVGTAPTITQPTAGNFLATGVTIK